VGGLRDPGGADADIQCPRPRPPGSLDRRAWRGFSRGFTWRGRRRCGWMSRSRMERFGGAPGGRASRSGQMALRAEGDVRFRGPGLPAYVPWTFLLLTVATALAPLVVLTFPVSHDGLEHVFRVFVLDDALRRGVLFPRWVDSLYMGLGYPL